MTKVDHFIAGLSTQQQTIVTFFHQLLTEEFLLNDKIRFKIPFYYGKSWICYLNPVKNDGIEFAFVRGNELSNHQGLLENKGRKQVSGITFFKLDDLPIQSITEIIQEAIILDDTIPYSSKNKG